MLSSTFLLKNIYLMLCFLKNIEARVLLCWYSSYFIIILPADRPKKNTVKTRRVFSEASESTICKHLGDVHITMNFIWCAVYENLSGYIKMRMKKKSNDEKGHQCELILYWTNAYGESHWWPVQYYWTKMIRICWSISVSPFTSF
jgi:hypothetical protein